jgi:hypothetical protein
MFMDPRTHTDPDIYAPSYSSESIGRWARRCAGRRREKLRGESPLRRQNVPISDQFHITERIRPIDGGEGLEIAYT